MHIMQFQYVGKAEVTFNLSLINHRKKTKKAISILVCNHNFKGKISTKHVKFIIIDKLVNLHCSKEELRVVRESFLGSEAKSASSI